MASFAYPVWNLIDVDREARTPLNEQLFARLRRAILAGHIARGARLPPSRSVAQELGVARNTVVLAYERLETEGYVRKRVGSGTFVENQLPEDHLPRPPPAADRREPQMARAASRRGGALLGMQIPRERIDAYDLSPGVPALDEFPYETFADIAARHWRARAPSHTGFDYVRGVSRLARQIALYLRETRGVACEPEQVLVVGSTLQAAILVSHLLLDRGDGVLVEDPTHVAEIAAFRMCGLTVRPVALDDDGFNIDAAGAEAGSARLAAVSPVEQFPFGCTMSEERRRALLQWAAAGGWIFEDDFNSEIRWAGQATPPLYAADPERVLYASSFNRVLAPGLRLAYMLVPPHLAELFAIGQRVFSFYAPAPDQALVAEFMEQGRLASHLRRMRAIYRERAAALAACLRQEVGGRLDVPEVRAGLHLTIRARDDMDDEAVSERLLGRNLDCPPLSRYYQGPARHRGLVLGFGNASLRRIRRCAGLIGWALAS